MKKLLVATSIALLLLSSLFADNAENQNTRFESLAKLSRVLDTIEKYYVDDLKINEIVDKTLKGLMSELDAHSSFLDKQASKQMKIDTQGEFGGLGITVGMKKGALTVISPIDNTPAFKAGVKPLDIILKIDNKSTLGITLDEAVKLMRGKPKTDITLTIIRKDIPKPLKIKITRDIITVQSVYTKKIEKENLLYIRVASFDAKVAQNIKKALLKNKNTKGIILDLRNNPGGLLNQAIETVDIFVNKGIIVSQKGRDQKSEEIFNAKKFSTKTNVPLVVLVNGGSASASEIVSGALQDHKRAIVVGEKTFGKGSVQAILPIDKNGSESIRLTIAKYYLPSGRTIQAVGVTPDITVNPGKVIQNKEDEFRIKESDLKKHLKNELNKINTKNKKIENKKENTNKKIITKKDILKDNQLNSAINILKSLIIINNK